MQWRYSLYNSELFICKWIPVDIDTWCAFISKSIICWRGIVFMSSTQITYRNSAIYFFTLKYPTKIPRTIKSRYLSEWNTIFCWYVFADFSYNYKTLQFNTQTAFFLFYDCSFFIYYGLKYGIILISSIDYLLLSKMNVNLCYRDIYLH